MTRNRIIALVVALTLLAAGWYFASPHWTLRQMAAAAEARDADALATYVDFPPLRDSLKTQLRGQMAARVVKGRETGSFAALGAMLAMSLLDPMIDAMLTPEAMRAGFAAAPATVRTRPTGFNARDSHVVYDGIDRFRLVPDAGGPDGSLIFVRHGLGWKLADIRLPTDLMGHRP